MKIIAFVIMLLTAAVANAATLDNQQSARKLTDQVMAKVGSGETEAGLLLMKPYSVVAESEFSVLLEKTKLQLPAIEVRFGKAIGAEFLSEKMVGKSLLRIVQLQKFEKHAMRWSFYFYNAGGKWTINSFNFDDNIRAAFHE